MRGCASPSPTARRRSRTRGGTRTPRTPHPPTFCIYQKFNPGDPELHCDFVWLSPDMRDRLAGVGVDTATQASDHQPVVVTFR